MENMANAQASDTDIFLQDCMLRLMTRLQHALTNNPPDLDYLGYVVTQERTVLSAAGQILQNEINEALEELHFLLMRQTHSSPSPSVTWQVTHNGRFRLDISEEHIKSLLGLGLSATCIAEVTGVSRRTIFRRMSDFNLSVTSQYSTMSDDELDVKVNAVKSRLPHAGYRLVKGCLKSEGYHVQWERVKASMHRVDTAGILDRLMGMGCVVRRTYYVRGPRYLQHIDTNHKLIRYNIVIFGGIEGFSRKIMFLNTATNNRAATAYGFFMEGVRKFGWPNFKVRADQGVENVDIARAMFTTRGTEHGSFISGKSVHNQRIERLWRDVWTAVTRVYYDILHSLEEEGLLDLADSLHLFCVHFVFVPRLQQDLERFARGWDNHSLRTERGRTPNQLWHLGLMENPVSEPEAAEEMQIDNIDWEDTGFEKDPDSGVVVPDIDCPLDQVTIAELRLAVEPTAHSFSFGKDIYLMCIRHASYLAGRVQ